MGYKFSRAIHGTEEQNQPMTEPELDFVGLKA